MNTAPLDFTLKELRLSLKGAREIEQQKKNEMAAPMKATK